jgi:hypothetical protein
MGCSVRRNCAYAGESSAMSPDDSSPVITDGGKIEQYTIIIMFSIMRNCSIPIVLLFMSNWDINHMSLYVHGTFIAENRGPSH